LSEPVLNKPKKSAVISHATVSENRLLVPLTQSKKLAAIRKQSQAPQTLEKKPAPSTEIAASGLNKNINDLLNEAQEHVNAKINELLAVYPPGKKNKMFALKYGSPDRIKQMNFKAIFTRLSMDKPKKFALIQHLDYFGNATVPIEALKPTLFEKQIDA
jgi:hypothetical protein